MKKYIIMVLMMVLAVAGLTYARSTGYGKLATATTTTARITLTANNTVSIYNPGTSVVHTLVNCTTSEFNTVYALTNCVMIPAGKSYTYDTQARQNIDSLCYKTAIGTSSIYISSF